MSRQTTLELLLKSRDQGAKRALDEVSGGLNEVDKSGDRVAGTMEMVGNAMRAFAAKETAQAVYEFARLGGESKRARARLEAFSGGAAEAGHNLQLLQEATKGAVNDQVLMAQGARFLQSGLAGSGEEMAEMAEMAEFLGDGTQSAARRIEDFGLMLLNTSVQRLDSYGMSASTVRARVEELTSSTENLSREEAFKIAVMEEGRKAMERVADVIEDDLLAYEQLETQLQNLKMTLAEGVTPELSRLITTITPLIEKGTAFSRSYSEAHEETGKLGSAVRILLPGVYSLATGIEALTTTTEETAPPLDEMAGNLNQIDEASGITSGAMIQMGQVAEASAVSMDAFERATAASAESAMTLSANLKDATDQQIANRLIGMLDPEKMGAQAYTNAVTEIGTAFGVMDERSIALAEGLPMLASAIEDGEIAMGDMSTALHYLIADAEDGELAIDEMGWTSRDAGRHVSTFGRGLERAGEGMRAINDQRLAHEPFADIGREAGNQAPAIGEFADQLGTTDERLRALVAGSPWSLSVIADGDGGGGGGGGGGGDDGGGGPQEDYGAAPTNNTVSITATVASGIDVEDLAYRVSEVLAQRMGSAVM